MNPYGLNLDRLKEEIGEAFYGKEMREVEEDMKQQSKSLEKAKQDYTNWLLEKDKIDAMKKKLVNEEKRENKYRAGVDEEQGVSDKPASGLSSEQFEDELNNGMRPSEIIKKYYGATTAQKHKVGHTYVRMENGQTVLVAGDNGQGQDEEISHKEYEFRRHAGILPQQQNSQTKPRREWSYDAPRPSKNGHLIIDDSESRNKASDKQFKMVDPCRQRNREEEDFMNSINSIK